MQQQLPAGMRMTLRQQRQPLRQRQARFEQCGKLPDKVDFLLPLPVARTLGLAALPANWQQILFSQLAQQALFISCQQLAFMQLLLAVNRLPPVEAKPGHLPDPSRAASPPARFRRG